MPDWVHAFLYIFIWAGTIFLFIYLLDDWLGLILGLLVGRVLAGLIVSRIPGFWGQ